MGVKLQEQVKLQEHKHIKPGELWYCHSCGRENTKKRGKQRQRCQSCGQHVHLGRSRLGRLARR